eukprot:TRINITY_DN982_c0_g1_i1.p1 TRINITY_DN982_c0_g1~~TRINITY_DN982_c0_g1_i1.p1  ORF type:complete len:231 (-),score=68.79 TRINITY_DN982_c0_g1_i1:43-735(-)
MSYDDDQFFYRDSIIIDAVPPPPEDGYNDLQELNDNIEQVDHNRDPQLTEREKELMQELNSLRSNPRVYFDLLVRRRKHFYLQSEMDQDQVQTNTNIREGKQAVLECIEHLENLSGVTEISFENGIHLASQDIRERIGNQNGTEPTSAEEVNDALYKYGSYRGNSVQLVGFGYDNPKEVLCHLLISDGDKSRKSRSILLNDDFRFGGLAMGDHGMVVFHFITEEWTPNYY